MLNTFAFSTENILRSIYAFVALDSITSGKERPSILGRDQEPALRQVVRNCASDLILRLTPAAIASSLSSDDDSDLITVDFDIPDTPAREMIRPAVETILAAMAMAVSWGGSNRTLADVYTHIATSGYDRLADVLGIYGRPEPIRPGI